MRLVKLIAYSLLGYVLYELYLGMTEGAQVASAGSTKQPARRRRRNAGGGGVAAGGAAGGAAVGGGSSGKRVEVQDADGAHETRSVGRGIVH